MGILLVSIPQKNVDELLTFLNAKIDASVPEEVDAIKEMVIDLGGANGLLTLRGFAYEGENFRSCSFIHSYKDEDEEIEIDHPITMPWANYHIDNRFIEFERNAQISIYVSENIESPIVVDASKAYPMFSDAVRHFYSGHKKWLAGDNCLVDIWGHRWKRCGHGKDIFPAISELMLDCETRFWTMPLEIEGAIAEIIINELGEDFLPYDKELVGKLDGVLTGVKSVITDIDQIPIFREDRESHPPEQRTLPWKETRDGITVIVEPEHPKIKGMRAFRLNTREYCHYSQWTDFGGRARFYGHVSISGDDLIKEALARIAEASQMGLEDSVTQAESPPVLPRSHI